MQTEPVQMTSYLLKLNKIFVFIWMQTVVSSCTISVYGKVSNYFGAEDPSFLRHT